MRRLAAVVVVMVGCGRGGRAAPDGGRVIAEDGARIAVRCLAPSAPAAEEEACACDTDCENALACVAGAGAEVGVCRRDCRSDGDCEPDDVCSTLRFGPERFRCIRACASSAECSAGYCAYRQCIDLCQRDADCPAGRGCDLYSHECVPPDYTPVGKRNNERCASDDECRSGFCVAARCRSNCARSVAACPPEDFCWGTGEHQDLGACLQRCDTAAECYGEDEDCVDVRDGERTARVCR